VHNTFRTSELTSRLLGGYAAPGRSQRDGKPLGATIAPEWNVNQS